MRKTIAAAVLVGCMSAGVTWAEDPANNAGRNMQHEKTVDDMSRSAVQATLPQGVTPKDLNDKQDERQILVEATNAALTKNGFDDLCERLSTLDRRRLGDAANRNVDELNGRVDQIAKVWKEKYGNEFKLNGDTLQSILVIREGEVSDPALARAHWPVPAFGMDADHANGQAVPAASSESNYLDKGRNVAVISIPASHGLPTLNVSMLHEAVDDWRIDIPDNISGDKLYSDLKDRLTNIGENVSNWPASEPEAYRMVAHNVLAAIYDVPMDTSKASDVGRTIRKTIDNTVHQNDSNR